MALRDEINAKSKEIITDQYAISIGELVSMYRDGDIDIHPEFQRFYRWTLSQKSKLIESFLLNIPIPPIFVYQRLDGVWDVVDGLQRLSTILEFMGEYKEADGNLLPPLKLEGTKYLPSLDGMKYDDPDDVEHSFAMFEKRYLKMARINCVIVKKESDESGKFEIFQRLNTGGTSLSDQEVRNCLMVMSKEDTYLKVKEMSEYPNFRNCLRVNDKAMDERYDMELVTRFLCLRTENMDVIRGIKDFGDYLDERIVKLINDDTVDWNNEIQIFKSTFDAIAQSLGNEAFCKFYPDLERFSGGHNAAAFELVAVTIGRHNGVTPNGDLRELVIDLWKNLDQEQISWRGANAATRLQRTLDNGNRLYEQN